MLKPQDVLVALTLVVEGALPFERLSEATGLALSQAHQSVQRLKAARLVGIERTVNRANLEEFLLHGVAYVWPPELGGPVNGMPTASSAPGLVDRFPAPDGGPRVWPAPKGAVRGMALQPLCKTAPMAAERSARLYTLLALVDAIRCGAAREKKMAGAELSAELRR